MTTQPRTTTRRGERRRQSDEDRAAAAAAREERLQELHRTLADGVAALRDGDAWRAWLKTASRFPRYSFNNQLLLLAQKPDATHVAGYRAWQALGRQVRHGEKALYVLAPMRPRSTTSPADPDNDRTSTDDGDRPATDPATPRRQRLTFRGAAVFDVSQTDGDPLPEPPHPQLLAGQAPDGLWETLVQVVESRGFTVARCSDPTTIRGANGLTDFTARTVTVRADVDAAQAVKTLAHETAHVLLHVTGSDPGGSWVTCRGVAEVEAESVAYLVSAHHGLDTTDYTFAYVAGWAPADHTVRATADRVLTATRTILDVTDPAPDLADADGLTHQVAGDIPLAAPGPTTAIAPAARATADIPRALKTGVAEGGDQAPTRQILAAAQAWFITQAADSPEYAAAVHARGHQPDTTCERGIGWAPPSWTGLVDHLRGLGYTDAELISAGVALASRGRTLDRFRGRITFPITDGGQIVGWTARDTTGHPDAPKYLNSPTSPHYDKSRLLYGTDRLTAEATTVVLVEGPWDAEAVTAAAGPHTVGLATCGTAVTAEHILLATAGGRRLVLGVDSDFAGARALGRTITLLASLDRAHPAAVTSSHGKDLADQYAHAPAGVLADLGHARAAGLVYAELLLPAARAAHTIEARIAASRAAAAHIAGTTINDHARLAQLLISRVGLTVDAALDIASPFASAPRSRVHRPNRLTPVVLQRPASEPVSAR